MSEQALQTLAQIFYLVSAALFILGLKGMTKVKSARQGNGIAAVGMLLAVIGTLIEAGRIDTTPWITHRASFDEVVSEFPVLVKPETGVIKAIIEL